MLDRRFFIKGCAASLYARQTPVYEKASLLQQHHDAPGLTYNCELMCEAALLVSCGMNLEQAAAAMKMYHRTIHRTLIDRVVDSLSQERHQNYTFHSLMRDSLRSKGFPASGKLNADHLRTVLRFGVNDIGISFWRCCASVANEVMLHVHSEKMQQGNLTSSSSVQMVRDFRLGSVMSVDIPEAGDPTYQSSLETFARSLLFGSQVFLSDDLQGFCDLCWECGKQAAHVVERNLALLLNNYNLPQYNFALDGVGVSLAMEKWESQLGMPNTILTGSQQRAAANRLCLSTKHHGYFSPVSSAYLGREECNGHPNVWYLVDSELTRDGKPLLPLSIILRERHETPRLELPYIDMNSLSMSMRFAYDFGVALLHPRRLMRIRPS